MKHESKVAPTVEGRGASDSEAMATSVGRAGRDAVAAALKMALADSYAMYLKTLGVHWNVTGPSFYGLHKLTDAQYQDLHAAADAIAERIRSLGHVAPASFSEFREASCVDVETPHKSTPAMLTELVADNEAVARRMLAASDIADEAGDKFSEDMLIARIGVHEQNAWMLRASLA
jgi:starvation-inducible DNA-binding protein